MSVSCILLQRGAGSRQNAITLIVKFLHVFFAQKNSQKVYRTVRYARFSYIFSMALLPDPDPGEPKLKRIQIQDTAFATVWLMMVG
jgi:hypothetical protein